MQLELELFYMTKLLTTRGVVTYLMLASVWLFFTAYNTDGQEKQVISKLIFLQEHRARFGGVYLYYRTLDGLKLRVSVDKATYIKLKYSDLNEQKECEINYFENESLVFNESNNVKSIACLGKVYYRLKK